MNTKSMFYLEIIKKSHETFKDYLSHISEDALDWKFHDYTVTARWIISHVIKDQKWFVNLILDKKGRSKDYKNFKKLEIEKIIAIFDEEMQENIAQLQKISDEDLNEIKEVKGYPMKVEDLLFEYIHHLSHHGGQLAQIMNAWKREQRA